MLPLLPGSAGVYCLFPSIVDPVSLVLGSFTCFPFHLQTERKKGTSHDVLTILDGPRLALPATPAGAMLSIDDILQPKRE